MYNILKATQLIYPCSKTNTGQIAVLVKCDNHLTRW
jgi:hypothetical protein